MKHILITTIATIELVGCAAKQKEFDASNKIEGHDLKIFYTDKTAKASDISMHKAAEEGNILAVKQHLAAGTDFNALNNFGETPLDLAEGEIADFILKSGGKTSVWLRADESIHLAAEAGHIEAVKKHLASGADVNEKDKDELNDGFTPLHHAAYKGYKKLVKIIIESGANINSTSDKQVTPLNTAVGMGSVSYTHLTLPTKA